MTRFEELLAGKAKVMGESTGVSAEDFSPLSSGAAHQSTQYHERSPSSPSDQADLGKDQLSWRSLFGSNLSSSLQYNEPIMRDGKPLVKISH